MASVAEALEHLVRQAPGLDGERRQEFLDAIAADPALAADRAVHEQPAPPVPPYQMPSLYPPPQGD